MTDIKNKQAKINEQEKKYKQFVALADINFKNKNFKEALAIYHKAEDTGYPDKIHSVEKIQAIETILKKADDDKKKTDLKVLPIIAKDTVTSILITKTGIIFKVQFASTDKEINLKTKFTNVEDIWFYKTGNVFKYTSGNFATMEEATKQQFKLKEKGYKDCFVAAFKNNVRIDINEARKLTE